MTSSSEDFAGMIEGISDMPYELQQEPRWADERNKILTSLKRDAEGLPMSTAQDLLMERMATFYAITRKREADPDAKVSASDLKNNSQIWLQMTSEFYKQITVGEDKRRHALITSIHKIIANTLIMVEDDMVREGMRKTLAAGFRDIGL